MIVAFLSALITLLAEDNFINNKPDRKFEFIHIGLDITILALLMIQTITTWYVNSVTPGAIVAEIYPNLCSIFKIWDAQNLRLIPPDSEVYYYEGISSRFETSNNPRFQTLM